MMPKMKTHRAGAKRYKLTGTGKLLRRQAGSTSKNNKPKKGVVRDGPFSVCQKSQIRAYQLNFKQKSI